MKPEWEHTSAVSALPGTILGAALGADCLLAAAGFGDVPAILCGAVIVLLAVRGGALSAGKTGRSRTLLALPWALLFACLGHHLAFALETAPGDPVRVP